MVFGLQRPLTTRLQGFQTKFIGIVSVVPFRTTVSEESFFVSIHLLLQLDFDLIKQSVPKVQDL